LELKELRITTSGYEYIDFLASDRSRPQFRNAMIDGGSFGSGTGIVLYDIYGNNTLMLAPGFDVALDLQIDYIQLVPDLALPTDEPTLIPTKYHNMIPDYAVLEALRSSNDARFSKYDEKVKGAEKLLSVGVQPRQVRETKVVYGYMEGEEY
jgi:hypothetical protein